MRSVVDAGARSCVVAFLITGLLKLPVTAASAQPLGMVVTAEHARLGNASAVTGTAFYPGDALATESDGSMRLKIGASQVYLLSSTAATLLQQGNKVQAKVERGTLGFSMPALGQLEIGTPLGVVRAANGQRVLGQVVVLSPSKIQVSAYDGTLVVAASSGPEKTIEPGESYEATLVSDAGPSDAGSQGVGSDGINWKRVGITALIIGGAAVTVAIIWHDTTESCSVPSSCD